MLKRDFKTLLWPAFLVLPLMLMACNGTADSDESNGNTSNNGTDSENDSDEVTELSIFVDHTYWPLSDWSGEVPEEITDRTGIALDVQVASDAQQLALMISSGDLPDMVFTDMNFQEMSNENVSYSLDELIDEYNIEGLEFDPMARVLNQGEDGELYAVRNGFTDPEDFESIPAALGNVPQLSFRTDIMEELGNPELENLDDFVDLLQTVQLEYPEMTPLVMAPAVLGQYFRVNFGASYVQGFQMVDDEVKYYIEQPEQLDYYLFMNELYREGLVTAENFSWSDQDQANSRMINGEAFAINNNTEWQAINAEIEQTGGDFRIEQFPKLLGENPSLQSNSAGWSGTFITKNTDNPEAAIKFLEFMYSEEGQQLGLWGIEEEHWTMDEPIEDGGYPEFTYDSQSAVEQVELGSVWWGLLINDGIYEQVQRYVPGTITTEAMVDAKQYTRNNPLMAGIELPGDSEYQVIKAELDNMVTNEQINIYLAESEEEAVEAYEAMMDTADQIGMQTLNEFADEQYRILEQEYEEERDE